MSHPIEITEQQLHELYVEQCLTTRKIAQCYNCCPSTICQWLKRFNIKARTFSDYRARIGKDFLITEYVVNKKSTYQIAKEWGYSSDESIRKWLKCYGIERRKTGPIAGGENTYSNQEWLTDEYIIKRKTMLQIAEEQGVGETVIHKWLTRYGIIKWSRSERLSNRIRTLEHCKNISLAKLGKQKGEGNPNWRGGITGENKLARACYAYKTWKCKVLERDDFTCQKCGSKEQVHAHHIKEFGKYRSLRFVVDNGITLCKECHRVAHDYNVTF